MTEQETQVPEQLAKYVAALVNGTHEIASVTIRPKLEWVGLTDEEIITHFQTNVDTGSLLSFADGARYAEAKLKEKNT